ncbi:DUF4335 domain-containing protein [Dactylococcopsis salina]|uniref:DUF4335 domain-containing protein n=1 Tax=Dactylococcopsis salina (strain PCC 8305) TaxID=13035 RepID=K9YSX5_DACS8|nr:DUF4335 domain-containing protein [Dactylococcopsis salina]AFZ49460.1 hypothetical protein Dacsa_0701 [Dactylococcopsis salina PCC 8305]
MTIRRQYSLPNCSLTLEGWTGETNPNDGGNGRPLMSILVNAECRFTDPKHQSSVLQGDKNFLESLVRVVNNYAQSVLSGIIAQPTQDWVGESFSIKPLPEQNRHQLQFIRTEEGKTEEIIKIDLTTVELFDLVEAIDQLLSDGTTLPELTLSLQPRSRKIRGQNEPLAKKAKPAMVGVASLAVASIALLFAPIPEIREPETQNSQQEETSTNNTAVPSGITGILADTPRITNSQQLASLADILEANIDENWQQRGLVEQSLTYRVWVNPSGDIIGYEQLSGSDRNLSETPVLPNLLSLSSPGESPQPQAVAELEVTFNPNGVVNVETQ